MKYRFIILFILLGFGALLAPNAEATGQPINSSAQLCWKKSECFERRQFLSLNDLTDGELAKGFVQNKETLKACGGSTDAANEKIGFCLPAGGAETAVSFGGKNRFENFGEFIAFIYRYGTWAATIIAVFIVLIGGIQWMVSGGNSAMIDSAKKRIGGAIMGLILLALSYTILNTLNPYLVNFRLPNVWLVNELELSPPLCSQLRDDQKLFQIAEPGKEVTPVMREQAYKTARNTDKYNKKPNQATCGAEYLVEGKASQSCTGTLCPDKKFTVCQQIDVSGADNVKRFKPGCSSGDIIIHFKVSSLYQKVLEAIPFSGAVTNKVKSPVWVDTGNTETYVVPVCSENTYAPIVALNNTGPNSLGSSGQIWIESVKPQPASKQSLLVPGPFQEHDIHYAGLDDSKFNCGGSKPIGFLIRHDLLTPYQVTSPTEVSDPNMWIGWIRGTQQGVAGSFDDVKNFFIPYKEATQGGLLFDITLTQTEVDSIKKDIGSGPPVPTKSSNFKGVNIDPTTGKPIVPVGPGKL